ncbi:phosphotransferase family protein [Sinorhizobium meliloti]|uniref:phosphotransferase family protein n=1 Tax=Rhizobium meliloti TaxID=382 RepID=UPI003D659535
MSPDAIARLAALIGAQSTDVRVVEAGQNNRVLDFGDRIVRIPRHAQAEAALWREAELLGRLRPALPITVPDVTVVESEFGPIAVHDRLPGEPFYSLDGFDDCDRERLVRDLGSFLRRLHELPSTKVLDGHLEDSWQELADRLPCDVLPRLSPATRAAVDAAFCRFTEQAGNLPVAAIHGDFGTGNILADRNRVTGVIDFAGCGLGDPAYDIASLGAGLGNCFLSQLQPHYPGLPAMAERISFYQGTFPLMDILFGLDHGNEAAIADGIAGAERLFAARANSADGSFCGS